jgi:hypothetical protein
MTAWSVREQAVCFWDEDWVQRLVINANLIYDHTDDYAYFWNKDSTSLILPCKLIVEECWSCEIKIDVVLVQNVTMYLSVTTSLEWFIFWGGQESVREWPMCCCVTWHQLQICLLWPPNELTRKEERKQLGSGRNRTKENKTEELKF